MFRRNILIPCIFAVPFDARCDQIENALKTSSTEDIIIKWRTGKWLRLTSNQFMWVCACVCVWAYVAKGGRFPLLISSGVWALVRMWAIDSQHQDCLYSRGIRHRLLFRCELLSNACVKSMTTIGSFPNWEKILFSKFNFSVFFLFFDHFFCAHQTKWWTISKHIHQVSGDNFDKKTHKHQPICLTLRFQFT